VEIVDLASGFRVARIDLGPNPLAGLSTLSDQYAALEI